MDSTMDLLNRALTERELSQTEWCRELQVNRTALAVAKMRGRLSPTLAGNVARLMGEDVEHWITIAALEAEPDSKGKQTLVRKLNSWSANLAKL
jgi:plasmid maintenance system antidote protein VapI